MLALRWNGRHDVTDTAQQDPSKGPAFHCKGAPRIGRAFRRRCCLDEGKAGSNRPFLLETPLEPLGAALESVGENMMKRRNPKLMTGQELVCTWVLERINFITDCPDRKDGGIVCT